MPHRPFERGVGETPATVAEFGISVAGLRTILGSIAISAAVLVADGSMYDSAGFAALAD